MKKGAYTVSAAADNTIARIIHLVEEAQASKAPTARFIDGFSRVYTPAAMAFATLVVILPPLLGMISRRRQQTTSSETSLDFKRAA